MNTKELQKKLDETLITKRKLEQAYQQIVGQEALLKEMIEEENKKEKKDPKEEKK